MDISNLYPALAWSALFFALMLAPAHLSFRYIEAPFLKYRRRYAKVA